MSPELAQPEAKVPPPNRLGWRLLCLVFFAALMGGGSDPQPFWSRMLMATIGFAFLLEVIRPEQPRSRKFPPPIPWWRILGALGFGLVMGWRWELHSTWERAAVAGLAMALGMTLAFRGTRKPQAQ